jgi:hypothetical protein
MSNTNKSAAPTRALGAPLLLAAAIALEVTGMQALSQVHTRWATAAGADGQTIYTQVERTQDTLAQADN